MSARDVVATLEEQVAPNSPIELSDDDLDQVIGSGKTSGNDSESSITNIVIIVFAGGHPDHH